MTITAVLVPLRTELLKGETPRTARVPEATLISPPCCRPRSIALMTSGQIGLDIVGDGSTAGVMRLRCGAWWIFSRFGGLSFEDVQRFDVRPQLP